MPTNILIWHWCERDHYHFISSWHSRPQAPLRWQEGSTRCTEDRDYSVIRGRWQMYFRARSWQDQGTGSDPRSKGFRGTSMGSTLSSPEDQIHTLKCNYTRSGTFPLFYSLIYLEHLEEFLAYCWASINMYGRNQMRIQREMHFIYCKVPSNIEY